MKKIIFLLAFLPGLFHAQDLSWGVSTNLGMSKVNEAFGYNLGRNNALNLSTYLSYRVLGPFYLKGELFAQSNRIKNIYGYTAITQYYDPSIDLYYYWDCYVRYLNQFKVNHFGLSTILGCKLGNFDLYGGLAFNLVNNAKVKVEEGIDVLHFALENWPSDVQLVGDQEIYNQNLSDAQLQADNFMIVYDKSKLVYGVQYHMNNLNFGYRRSYGFHQLTIGYDIGRYRYE